MTSADAPLLEQLLDAARAEVAVQQVLTDAEGAYRRAWWTTTLLLGHDIPHGDVGRIIAAVAKALNVSRGSVQDRRSLARRIAPEVIADGSIHGTLSTHAREFLVATKLPTIGPPEVVELQKLEADGWSIREIRNGGTELRSRLGIVEPPPPPTRASPRSQPTARLNGAQSIAFGQRVRLQEGPGVSLVRLANGALDVVASYESRVDRFQLTAEGAVIEGAA